MLAVCFTLNMFSRGLGDTYAVFILPLEREFGWSRSELTGVYSVYLVVHGCTAPLVGLLFDRLGPRWVYAVGTACLAAAFFLAGRLFALWQFHLFIGLLVGLGVSLNGMVPGSALLARWFRARLSTAMGVAYSAVGFGTIVFVPLAQYLVAQYDWRTAYRAMGLALIALFPVVAFVLPWKSFARGAPEPRRGPAASRATAGWTLREAVRTPLYLGLAQLFFFTAAGMFSITVQLVAFFVDAGFSPLAAATAYGFVGMLSAGSIMVSGVLSDRFGYRRTVTVSFMGTALGMLVLVALASYPSVALLALFVAVFGVCMGARGPVVSSICAKEFAGPNVATIYGTIYSTNALGAAFGAWMGGLLHDLTGGYRLGLAMSLFFIGLASAPFWTIRALKEYR